MGRFPEAKPSVLVGIALLAIVCTLFGGGKMRSVGGRGATALPVFQSAHVGFWFT